MAVTYNNKLAEWAKELLSSHNILTLRQAEYRTHISYTAVKHLLDGRVPDAVTIIRFASAFGASIPEALRLAGHEDIAETWETGRQPEDPNWPAAGSALPELTYEPLPDDEGEILEYYRGIPPALQENALQLLKTLFNTVDNSHIGAKTYGKRRKNIEITPKSSKTVEYRIAEGKAGDPPAE